MNMTQLSQQINIVARQMQPTSAIQAQPTSAIQAQQGNNWAPNPWMATQQHQQLLPQQQLHQQQLVQQQVQQQTLAHQNSGQMPTNIHR